jgi:hypothetical protein
VGVLSALIHPGEVIFDPFAGHGLRLGSLCDRLGAVFYGCDIEDWSPRDMRVRLGNARDAQVYPEAPFTICTSPVYQNKRCADYANGPTPTTKAKGRRDYGIALGRPLHQDNFARHTGHPSRANAYYTAHGQVIKHWDRRVILNVDAPIGAEWEDLLEEHGYAVRVWIEVTTRRYGGLDNAEKRAPHEVVMEAWRK